MRRISLFSLLVLMIGIIIIPGVCFADAVGSYSLSTFYAKIETPTVGKTLPTDVEIGSQYTLKSIKWYDSSEKAVASSDVAKDGQYKAIVEITKAGGDRFATTTRVYVNGLANNVEKDITTLTSNYLKFSWTCKAVASSRRLSDAGGKGNLDNLYTMIDKVDFTIPEPKIGNMAAKKGELKWNESLSDAITVDAVSWIDDAGGLFMDTNKPYKAGKYSVRIFVKPTGKYAFADKMPVTLNGKKVNMTYVESSNQFRFEYSWDIKEVAEVHFKDYSFPRNGQELDKSKVQLEDGFPGKISRVIYEMFRREMTGTATKGENLGLGVTIELNSGYTFASSPNAIIGGKTQTQRIHTADDGDSKYTFLWEFTVEDTNTITIKEQSPAELEYQEDTKIELFVKADGVTKYQWYETSPSETTGGGAKQKFNKAVAISGATDSKYVIEKASKELDGHTYKCLLTSSDGSTKYTEETKLKLIAKEETKEDVKPEEKKWANKFEISITEPKIGVKPASTAKALNDEFKIGKVFWTAYSGKEPLDSAVTKFEEGYNYGVKIMVTVNEGYDLRSDYYGMVNGNQAEMPDDYKKEDFYVFYLFEMKSEEKALETSNEKIVWSSASKWATDELNSANESGLIPQVFDKEDLTKNITRKEFAHVAVRLYEKISGKKAEAEKENPFKDTKDTEVLKAYKVGITQGTSATTFEPDALITREQMATMMTRALQKAGVDTMIDLNKVEKFADDSEMSSWAKDSVYFMSSKEIIKGVGENKFGVKGNATREQSLLISGRSVEKFSH